MSPTSTFPQLATLGPWPVVRGALFLLSVFRVLFLNAPAGSGDRRRADWAGPKPGLEGNGRRLVQRRPW